MELAEYILCTSINNNSRSHTVGLSLKSSFFVARDGGYFDLVNASCTAPTPFVCIENGAREKSGGRGRGRGEKECAYVSCVCKKEVVSNNVKT